MPPLKTTYPGSDKDTDPWFDRLGHARTTLVRVKSDPDKTLELRDEWAHVMGHDEILGEEWVGETHFDYHPVREPLHRQHITTGGETQWNTLGHHLAWNYPMFTTGLLGK